MLDLGVLDLVFNSRYFIGIKSKIVDVFGVNGMFIFLEIKWIGVEFGFLYWKWCLVYVFFLEYLEDFKGEKILGLVGGKFFKKC